MKMNRAELLELFREVADERITAAITPLQEQSTKFMTSITAQVLNRGNDPDAEPGIVMARGIRALAACKGDAEVALRRAKEVWGADDPVVKLLEGGQVRAKQLQAGDTASGGFLVGPNFVTDLIELLRPASVVRSLNPTTLPLVNGTASVPKLTGGATAAYAGESANLTATEPATGMLNLSAKKLGAIVPISNDLLRYASIAADRVVRDDLVAAIAEREDLAFIRGDGLVDTPKGLRNWALAANVDASGAGTPATPSLIEIVADLTVQWLALRNANVRFLRPGMLMSPRSERIFRDSKNTNGVFIWRTEMVSGTPTIDGIPFRSTTQIPDTLGGGSDTEIYLVDFADAVIADDGTVEIDASPNAAYFDGTSVQASFSRDETVIRAITRHDFGMRHDASIHVLTHEWDDAP